MKKLVYLFAVVAIMLSFSSCGSSNSPKGAAEEYMKLTMKGDFEKIMEISYFTDKIEDEDRKMLAGLMASGAESKAKITSYKFVEEEIAEDGNSAVVTYQKTLDDGTELSEHVDVVLIDGKWMVDGGK
ncbi:MAG: DUF4878 domain-containing protein [bacterium]